MPTKALAEVLRHCNHTSGQIHWHEEPSEEQHHKERLWKQMTARDTILSRPVLVLTPRTQKMTAEVPGPWTGRERILTPYWHLNYLEPFLRLQTITSN